MNSLNKSSKKSGKIREGKLNCLVSKDEKLVLK